MGAVLTQRTEALRLKDSLERGEVNDQQLAHDGAQHSVAEHPVTAQPQLMHHPSLTGIKEQVSGCVAGLGFETLSVTQGARTAPFWAGQGVQGL